MTSVSSKTYSFTNGTANDAGPVDSEFTTLFTNDATLAADLTTIQSGTYTFTGAKSFSSTISTPGITEYVSGEGSTLDGMRGIDGRANVASIVATFSGVDTTTDVITFAAAHGRATGDAVKVRAVPGATLDTGLSASTTYYLRSVSATTATLHPTSSDASGNTNTVNISAAGSGTRHLIATPASPNEGDIWVDSSGLRVRVGGATVGVGEAVTAITARSSNTILGVNDKGGVFHLSSTFTQTLDAAATLGSKWYVYIRNTGTEIITLDPNSSETIDGATTLKVYQGESFLLVCDGSNFTTYGRQRSGPILITSQSASASATIDFTTGISSDFDKYVVEILDYKPATDATDLYLRFSTDTGSSFISANYNYAVFGSSNGGSVPLSGSAVGFIKLNGSTLGNAGSETSFFTVEISTPSASNNKRVKWTGHGTRSNAGEPETTVGSGTYTGATTAIDAIRFLSSSGNITSGTFKLYGVR